MGKAGDVQDSRRCRAKPSVVMMMTSATFAIPMAVPISRAATIGTALWRERGLSGMGFSAKTAQHVGDHRIPGNPQTLRA